LRRTARLFAELVARRRQRPARPSKIRPIIVGFIKISFEIRVAPAVPSLLDVSRLARGDVGPFESTKGRQCQRLRQLSGVIDLGYAGTVQRFCHGIQLLRGAHVQRYRRSPRCSKFFAPAGSRSGPGS
jgi:hypothetical protein